MWKWLRNLRVPARDEPAADTSFIERHVGIGPGKYFALYRYLANRYADVTVLTFQQIEDVLGFALPPVARTQQAWWLNAAGTVDTTSYAAAWILAGRTATPNLQTKTVVFERTAPVKGRPG
jgi:hypothetical protein